MVLIEAYLFYLFIFIGSNIYKELSLLIISFYSLSTININEILRVSKLINNY